jgi:indole-3-glycerol phosphate synthase
MASEVPDLLQRIVARRRERLAGGSDEGLKTPSVGIPELSPSPNPFLTALEAHRGRAVIAEVKMGSPHLGSLAGQIDPERQARLYAEHGAAALSVVVEPDFFFGSYELLARCRSAAGLPTIAKDFVVHEKQLEWARAAGADAVLLIAALYPAAELLEWAERSRARGLVPLVETHGAEDLGKLAGAEWELVGVNARDLRTFDVDLAHVEAMGPRLPSGAVRVAESGIASAADVRRLAGAGYDAFLVGESLLLAPDPAALLRELVPTRSVH